ncbi:hypothetical protein A9Q91_03765 [Candidatus Gracilibacteria bacterium 28_42_T64]|nr:hypothetical protein A9Q91_03765 [Candidatus Gracilibacteria bacterium 28_42_T64]
MSLSAQEYNQRYTDDLEESFQGLISDIENIEDLLGNFHNKQKISDDLIDLKQAVLEIYDNKETVDWKLIQPLKKKLQALENIIKGYDSITKKSLSARFKLSQEIVIEIGNLQTRSDNKTLGQLVESDSLFNTVVLNKLDDLSDSMLDFFSTGIDNLKRSEGSQATLSDRFQSSYDEFTSQSGDVISKFLVGLEGEFDTLSKKEQLFLIVESIFLAIKEGAIEFVGPKKVMVLIPDSVLLSFKKYFKTSNNNGLDIDDIYDFCKELYSNSDDFKEMLMELGLNEISENDELFASN